MRSLRLPLLAALVGAFLCFGVAEAAAVVAVPYMAPTVQAAVDMAPPGDTIVIYPGTYPGSAIVYKPVTIVAAAGPGSVVLDGVGAPDVLRLQAFGIRLVDLVVRNSSPDVFGSGVEFAGVSGCVAERVEAYGCGRGFGFEGSSGNLMIDCNSHDNVNAGYDFGDRGSPGNTAQRCYAARNTYGFIGYSSADGTVLHDCTAEYNTGAGIQFGWISGYVVDGCTSRYNACGVQLDTCRFGPGTITGSTLTNNSGDGINCGGYGEWDLQVRDSTIADNGRAGVFLFMWCDRNTFEDNDFTGNAYGVYVWRHDWGGMGNSRFVHNNFDNVTANAYNADTTAPQLWDSGYPGGGNWWSDHTSPDASSGPAQDVAGADGIVDTARMIPIAGVDNYPFAREAGWDNHPPVAEDDVFTGTEDVALSDNVLANDSDPDGDPLVATLLSPPTDGVLEFHADGSFTFTPDPDWRGVTSFTYEAGDGVLTDAATVQLTIGAVNDGPTMDVVPDAQSIQYSDPMVEALVSASDIDGPGLIVDVAGLPAALSAGPWSTVEVPGLDTGYLVTGGIGGFIDVPQGAYLATATASDGSLSAEHPVAFDVHPEDLSVTFADDNVRAVKVASAGGASGAFMLAVNVAEEDDGSPGDITRAVVAVRLVSVAGGANIDGLVVGPDSDGHLTAAFTGVPVGAYSVVVTSSGGYYAGNGEDVLAVYDPSLGFASGGGTFIWPGSTDKTNFAFVAAYGRKTTFKGSLLMIRHYADGTIERVKSNAISSVSLGGTSVPWATMTGKATYAGTVYPLGAGNNTFQLYAEDNGEPGVGRDRFWIRVLDRDGMLLSPVSLAMPGSVGAQLITGGNIQVPHKAR